MANPTLDDRTFQHQFEQAQAAAELANLTELRALAKPPGTGIEAYYDSIARTITVRLRSGASFSFPVDIVQGLAGAETQDLNQVEITPMGDGLHWETLDTDFTIAGLLAGRFGTKKWMTKLQQEWLQPTC
jgi:Protein of unknown function (DUF2442)